MTTRAAQIIDDIRHAQTLAQQPDTHATPGMTLRDWFAAQALAGFLANCGEDPAPLRCAAIAYELADAMLIVRAREDPACPE